MISSLLSLNRHCEPVNMRLTRETAPSGTGYTAIITARCQPDGPVTAGVLRPSSSIAIRAPYCHAASLRPRAAMTRIILAIAFAGMLAGAAHAADAPQYLFHG